METTPRSQRDPSISEAPLSADASMRVAPLSLPAAGPLSLPADAGDACWNTCAPVCVEHVRARVRVCVPMCVRARAFVHVGVRAHAPARHRGSLKPFSPTRKVTTPASSASPPQSSAAAAAGTTSGRVSSSRASLWPTRVCTRAALATPRLCVGGDKGGCWTCVCGGGGVGAHVCRRGSMGGLHALPPPAPVSRKERNAAGAGAEGGVGPVGQINRPSRPIIQAEGRRERERERRGGGGEGEGEGEGGTGRERARKREREKERGGGGGSAGRVR